MRSLALAPTLAAAALIGLAGAGCGAKTGPYVPDAFENETFDAGVPEDMAMTDMDIPCIEVPLDGGAVQLELEVEAEVGRADIAFLIDKTASMREEIDQIRNTLRARIAPAIRRAIPDSELAVATFADFPVEPYGSESDGDVPFELRQRVTTDVALIQSAVGSIELSNGIDIQESQVEALYQLMTGDGLGDWVPRSSGCPRGGFGYACFRNDALPVVLLFTDAQFHNGPDGEFPYDDPTIRPAPAQYEDAVDILNRRDARVIGFNSSEGSRAVRRTLERLAQDTEALDGSEPLVYDIGSRGQELTTSVVSAIQTLAGTVVQDIDAVLSDGDRTDGVDPLELIEAIEATEARPPDGVRAIEGAVFREAQAGTQLFWQVTIRNDAVAPGVGPQRIRVRVTFRGDGTRRLGEQLFDIVVPGADGSGCDDL